LGCWISPCYGPFSFGARFETYEPVISLIFQFFSGRGKPRVTESADTESVDTGARQYFLPLSVSLFLHQLLTKNYKRFCITISVIIIIIIIIIIITQSDFFFKLSSGTENFKRQSPYIEESVFFFHKSGLPKLNDM
jgi:hypothetical protein